MEVPEFIKDIPPFVRILGIALIAAVAHQVVRIFKRTGEWALTPAGNRRDAFIDIFPKIATITTILVSALTFTIYFSAFGLILHEFGISLMAYFASASVIGLAIGFGSQGLVQDVVIGLTLIFTDVLDIGDVVDLAGQTGRVKRIGLRFTVLVNLHDQQIYVPNRNISQINRYRNGYIRAYVDIQLPDDPDEQALTQLITRTAQGIHAQYNAIVLRSPELMGIRSAEPGEWRYLRVKFHLWPGQQSLIETIFKQRTLAAIKKINADYPDFMITVTYRVASTD